MRLGLWRDARLKLDVGCWEVGLGMIHCVCIMQSPNKTSHFTTYPSSNNQGSSKWVPVRKFCFIQKFRAIFHFHDYGRKGRYSTYVYVRFISVLGSLQVPSFPGASRRQGIRHRDYVIRAQHIVEVDVEASMLACACKIAPGPERS